MLVVYELKKAVSAAFDSAKCKICTVFKVAPVTRTRCVVAKFSTYLGGKTTTCVFFIASWFIDIFTMYITRLEGSIEALSGFDDRIDRKLYAEFFIKSGLHQMLSLPMPPVYTGH